MEKPEGPNRTKDMLEDMKRNMPILIQYTIMQAQITRTKFNALRDAGFTEDQALKLCMEVKA